MVATGGSDGAVCLVRLDTKKIIAKFQHGEPIQHQNQSNDDDDVEVEQEGCSVESVAFCPKLPWLVSGGTDGRVIVWDLAVQAKRSILSHGANNAIVRSLFIPDSIILITACSDNLVRKWDVRASQLLKTYMGHSEAILDMTLLSDGKHVVTA